MFQARQSLPLLLHRLLFLLLAATTSLADKEAFYGSDKYNHGDYGRFVTQEFASTKVVAPWLNFMKPFTNCDDGSYFFVAPRGNVANATPFILDANGSLVWAPDHHYGEVYNFMVQEYKGQKYLTFWSGDDSIGGHGVGQYHMLDQHYEEFLTIKGANGLGADLHSFTITPENTATFTLYDVHEVDVSSVRPAQTTGFIWDSLFQEINVETGEAIFQWRASDHFNLSDSYTGINTASENDPWDFFHINCVEKDYLGNYLVSSRFLRTIAYIDGKTGAVLWQFGGKNNSFKDLSGGDATTIVGQHDAHWVDNHTAITFFDNRGDWYFQLDRESRASRVKLDLDNMTAEVDHFYKNPRKIYSTSQGSFQTLPNGNALIGYGFNGVYTEFNRKGDVLCDAYMMPAIRFGSGDVQSYRNLKFHWTGIPKTLPALVLRQKILYMSWRGTTETRSWLLEDSAREKGTYGPLMTIAKDGFETKFTLGKGLCVKKYVRAIALDEKGERLATSKPIWLGGAANTCPGEFHPPAEVADEAELEQNAQDEQDTTEDDIDSIARRLQADWQLLLGFAFLAVISGFLVAWMALGSRVFTPFWRRDGRRPDYEAGLFRSPLVSGGLWNRIHALLPGSRKRWWDGNGHRRQGSDESDNMLSEVEMSEEGDSHENKDGDR